MKNHVFIATTKKLVAIQSILVEEDEVPSVMCVDGGNQITGVSTKYYDFVKKGTGIIAKAFRHNSYRLDVADDIDMGLSWQLPVYFGHYYQDKGLLGDGNPEEGDLITIASGIVKVNSEIHAVDGIEEKVFSLLTDLESFLKKGIPIKLVFPKSNKLAVSSALSKYGLEGHLSVEVAYVSSLSELHESHASSRADRLKKCRDSFFDLIQPLPSYPRSIYIAIAICLLTFGGIFLNQKFSLEKDASFDGASSGGIGSQGIGYEEKNSGDGEQTSITSLVLKVIRPDRDGECFRTNPYETYFPDSSNIIPTIEKAPGICFLMIEQALSKHAPSKLAPSKQAPQIKHVLLVDLLSGNTFHLDKLGASWYIPTPKAIGEKYYAIGVAYDGLRSSDLVEIRQRVMQSSERPITGPSLEKISSSTSKSIMFYSHRIKE